MRILVIYTFHTGNVRQKRMNWCMNTSRILEEKFSPVKMKIKVQPLPESEQESSSDAGKRVVFQDDVPYQNYESMCFGDVKSIHSMRAAIKDAVDFAVMRGPLLGYPLTRLSVLVKDLECPKGTLPGAVHAAVGKTLTSLLSETPMSLLEPIMKLEVVTEEQYVGGVLGDLTSQRRAQIGEIQMRENMRVLNATVPLSTMKGYSSALRSITAGNASCSLSFLDYGALSSTEQESIVNARKGIYFLTGACFHIYNVGTKKKGDFHQLWKPSSAALGTQSIFTSAGISDKVPMVWSLKEALSGFFSERDKIRAERRTGVTKILLGFGYFCTGLVYELVGILEEPDSQILSINLCF